MTKVVARLFISLDGGVESPDKWQFEHFGDDMMAQMVMHLNSPDKVLLGRVTYEYWAPYWPTSEDEPFASYINMTPKYIVSTTLSIVEWANSTLVAGDLAEAIDKLKQQEGGNIGVEGSPTLVRSMLQRGLIDELELMVHPVVAGKGRRLFQEVDELRRLKLISSKITRTGVAILTYQPVKSA